MTGETEKTEFELTDSLRGFVRLGVSYSVIYAIACKGAYDTVMVKRKSIRLSRSPASVLPLTGKGKRRGPPPRPRSSWARPRSWDPDGDLSQIIAVRRETGGWPRRTGEHSSLYRRINAARSGLYPELAQLLNDACPGWRDDAFPRTKQRAINTAIVQGRSPASTDTDENLPLRDHDRAQIEELVGNFIAQIVIIIHNLRPSNGGFTR